MGFTRLPKGVHGTKKVKNYYAAGNLQMHTAHSRTECPSRLPI